MTSRNLICSIVRSTCQIKHVEHCFNSGSAYIISVATANSVKAKFYTEDLPSIEDVS